jgi:hypothetical protein
MPVEALSIWSFCVGGEKRLSLLPPVPYKVSVLKSNLKIIRMNIASAQFDRNIKGFNMKVKSSLFSSWKGIL